MSCDLFGLNYVTYPNKLLLHHYFNRHIYRLDM